MTKIPNLTLNNGKTIPVLGLGTCQGLPGKECEIKQVIFDAIDIGYRHIDCAYIYGNETYIGEAIQEKIKQGVVKREDLFITSKLWNTFHKPELVEPALMRTLKNLQLEYLDLYLIHWPTGFKEGDDVMPLDENGEILISNTDYVDTWKAMEAVYKKGLTKAIGVSNFNSKQIDRILEAATVVPAINQIECHPLLNQFKLREYCESKGIKITSYSPLGSPARFWAQPGDPDVLNDEKVKAIAERYGKSPGQILIRYNTQLGNTAIPKASNFKRLKENAEVFDFALAPEDVSYVKSCERNGRVCLFEVAKGTPYYPFTPDEE